MALRGLLDTSVVIATTVADLPEEAAIVAATLAELHFGIHLAKDESTRALRLRDSPRSSRALPPFRSTTWWRERTASWPR